jgi:Flp pilus assembly protein TadB
MSEAHQAPTDLDKKAFEITTQTLNAELAALEEEKRRLASIATEGFGWRTVLGQFLLGVVIALLAISGMPSGANPGLAIAFGAAVFFLLFFIYLYRYRRARREEARQSQEATAELDEKIRLKQDEIARLGTAVPVRHRAGTLASELAAISRLETEIADLQEQGKSTRSKRWNRYWLAAILLGLIACVILVASVLMESELLFLASLVGGTALCAHFANLAIRRNDHLVKAVDQEIDRKQAELEKHRGSVARGG